MGAPNIQQQLYLKKALNENTDGMFDHPEVQNEETITEGLMGKIKSIGRKIKQRGILATTLKPYAHALARDKANRVGNADARGTARAWDKKKGFFDTAQAREAGKTAAKRFHRVANPNYGKHPWEIKKNISEDTITEGLRNKIKAIYDSIGEGYHMDRAHKILQSNASSKITPAEKARLKKAKAELDKIKPKYAPGQDPVVNSRKNS